MPELLDAPGGVATADLNATVMDWTPGRGSPEHLNDERDVLLVVLRGSAVVHVDDVEYPRAEGEAIVIEKGALRRVVAGPDGARILTAHRRRPGLQPTRIA
jgi:quercetin dioxygenase-like cupin family protein